MNKKQVRSGDGEFPPVRLFWVLLAVVLAVYSVPLWQFANYAWKTDLHSHCLLIPVVTAYLLWLRSPSTLLVRDCSYLRAFIFLLPGLTILGLLITNLGNHVSPSDRHSLWVFSFLLSGLALFVGLFGWQSLKRMCFPIAFLFFMIPLPDLAAELLEQVLMTASAVVTHWFFLLAGTTVEKEGQLLILPVIELEVARECSGIRSTWVLFITGVLGAHLFLQSSWHRFFLVAAILPLGIFRNALRIFVIGQLCMSGGPEMINHWIHRKGGPVFFGISLIPLFFLLVFLIWMEKKSKKA